MLEIIVQGETLVLHPFRAIYWPRIGALLISDLHLGKSAHFRRAGVPVPVAVSNQNWDRLLSLLVDLTPERVILLGDLFHSSWNAEWDEFCLLTEQFSRVQFELVPGNHDVLRAAHYAKAQLQMHEKTLSAGPFLFSHEPLPEIPSEFYNLAGHLHPSVRLRGTGRQRLRLPCFYFGERYGLLPAFGAFTGTAVIQPAAGDRVFVITADQVLAV